MPFDLFMPAHTAFKLALSTRREAAAIIVDTRPLPIFVGGAITEKTIPILGSLIELQNFSYKLQ